MLMRQSRVVDKVNALPGEVATEIWRLVFEEGYIVQGNMRGSRCLNTATSTQGPLKTAFTVIEKCDIPRDAAETYLLPAAASSLKISLAPENLNSQMLSLSQLFSPRHFYRIRHVDLGFQPRPSVAWTRKLFKSLPRLNKITFHQSRGGFGGHTLDTFVGNRGFAKFRMAKAEIACDALKEFVNEELLRRRGLEFELFISVLLDTGEMKFDRNNKLRRAQKTYWVPMRMSTDDWTLRVIDQPHLSVPQHRWRRLQNTS